MVQASAAALLCAGSILCRSSHSLYRYTALASKGWDKIWPTQSTSQRLESITQSIRREEAPLPNSSTLTSPGRCCHFSSQTHCQNEAPIDSYGLLDQTLYSIFMHDQRFLGNKVKQNKTQKKHGMSSFLLLPYTHTLSKQPRETWNPSPRAPPKPAHLKQESYSYSTWQSKAFCLRLFWGDFQCLVQNTKRGATYLW